MNTAQEIIRARTKNNHIKNEAIIITETIYCVFLFQLEISQNNSFMSVAKIIHFFILSIVDMEILLPYNSMIIYYFDCILMKIKLMKEKAPRKHSLHEKTAASVLLKLFISSNE